MDEKFFKVMGKINTECIDGRKGDSIETALTNFKLLVKENDNITIAIGYKENDTWYLLSEQELEIAQKLTEEMFNNVKFVKYAPSSIRLRKK
jgi:hypothetical protein